MWTGGLGNALVGMASGLRLAGQQQHQQQQQQGQPSQPSQQREQPPQSSLQPLRARVEAYVKGEIAPGARGGLEDLAADILDESLDRVVAQDALLYALEQPWCESRLAFNLAAMERALDLCKWIALGAEDPVVAGHRLIDQFGSSWPRCNRVWLSNHVAYRCKDCGTTESSCICVECFDPADHEGHDFRIYKSSSGGCCDCGDPNAWRPEGNCKAHRAISFASSTDAVLSPSIRRGASLVAGVFARELLLCVCDILLAISAPAARINVSPGADSAAPTPGDGGNSDDGLDLTQSDGVFSAAPQVSRSHLSRSAHTWRASNNFMDASMEHLRVLDDLATGGVQHFGVARDMYTEKRETLFGEIIRFLTQLCELGPPLRRLIAEDLVKSSPRAEPGAASGARAGVAATSRCIESFIRFGVFLQPKAQQALGIMVLRLLIDDDFKAHYTRAFVDNYSYLIVNYLGGIKFVRESINEYLDRILCQLCNSAEQVRHLVTGRSHDMLGVTVEAIHQLGRRTASPRRFDIVDLPNSTASPSDGNLALSSSPMSAHSASSPSGSSRRPRTLGSDGGFPPVSASPGVRNGIIDVSSEAVEARLFYRPIMDLRLLLVHDTVVRHAILERPEILKSALGIFALLQEVNPQTRKVDVHAEYEDRAVWESAFLLEMEMVCAFFRLVDGFKQVLREAEPPRPRALNTLRSSTLALAEWLQGQALVARRFVTMSTSQATGGDPFAGVVASLTHIVSSGSYTTSIHIPLHRFWAGVFHAAVEESDERTTFREILREGNGRTPSLPSGFMGGPDILDRLIALAEDAAPDGSQETPAGFACLAAEHPLRVLSKVAQIRARAWVRNGALVEIEPQQYLSRSWVWYGHDLDLFTLQYAASVMDGDSFFRWISKRFEVDEVLSYARSSRNLGETARRLSRRQRRAEAEKLDEDQLASVCETMLHLISVLAHDRTRLGETPTETLRKQVVHALVSSPGGKRTFSSVEACIPPRVLEEGGRLEDVLAEVADFNPPSAKDVEGTFSLKDTYWSGDLDLYYSHFTAEQRQAMEENYDLFHKRKRKRRDISSSLDSLPEGEALSLAEGNGPAPSSSSQAASSPSASQAKAGGSEGSSFSPALVNVTRLMAPSLDAPIFKAFAGVPFNLLFNAELHGAIFRILHACVRDEGGDAILSRPGILLEALSLLYQGVHLSAHLDIVGVYERELAEQLHPEAARTASASSSSSLGGAAGPPLASPLAGNKPRSRSCDGTIAWSWANADLQRCMSAPTDLRAMSMSINHRIDHVQHRVRLPFTNPVLNACELVPLADVPMDEDAMDHESSTSPRSQAPHSRQHASGSAGDWSWPKPEARIASSFGDASSTARTSFGGAAARAWANSAPRGSSDHSQNKAHVANSTVGRLPEPLSALAPRAHEERSVGVSIYLLLLQLVHNQDRWGRDVHDLASTLVHEITERMEKLAPGLRELDAQFAAAAGQGRATSPSARGATMSAGVIHVPGALGSDTSVLSSPDVSDAGSSAAEDSQAGASTSATSPLTGSTNPGSSGGKKRNKKKKKKSGAGSSTSSLGSGGSSARRGSEDGGELGSIAARQARIMANFAKKQASFLSNVKAQGVDLADSQEGSTTSDKAMAPEQAVATPTLTAQESSHAAGAGHAPAIQPLRREECALCRDYATSERPIGVVGFAGRGSLVGELLRQFRYGAPSLQGSAAREDRHELETTLVRACGHHVHFDCLETYRQSLTSANGPIDVELNEYRCPICRGLANTALLLFPEGDPAAIKNNGADGGEAGDAKMEGADEADAREHASWRNAADSFLRRITNNFRTFAPGADSLELGRLFHENSLLVICTVNENSALTMFQAFETLGYLSRSISQAMRAVIAEPSQRLDAVQRVETKLRNFAEFGYARRPMDLLCSWLLLQPQADAREVASHALAVSVGQAVVALALGQLASVEQGEPLLAEALAAGAEESPSSSPREMSGSATGPRSLASLVRDVVRRIRRLGDGARHGILGAEHAFAHGLPTLAARFERLGHLQPAIAAQELCTSFLQVFVIARAALDLQDHGAAGRQRWGAVRERLEAVERGSADLESLGVPTSDDLIFSKTEQILQGLGIVISNDRICERIVQSEVQLITTSPALTCAPRLELPGLLQLPQLYTDLYLQFCEGATSKRLDTCSSCMTPLSTETAMICLHCGQTLCLDFNCQSAGVQRRLVQHAKDCPGVVCKAVCAFLPAYTSSAFIVINETRMMEFGSIFLDSHGEADPLLRRGKPLYVSEARMQQLRRLVCGLGFTTEMAGMRRMSQFLVD